MKTSIYPVLITVVLTCFVLSPQARAVCREGCFADNTFLGEDALLNNTGSDNTTIGFNALVNNTTGRDNTATGSKALLSNTTGVNNTATGSQALLSSTTGDNNTATGTSALLFSTTGDNNTATGLSALAFNTSGSFNTATGSAALGFNTTGDNNTAIGASALLRNTTGIENTAIGYSALTNNAGNNNIAVGANTGLNLFIGSHNIYMGNRGVHVESGAIRIGTPGISTKTLIAGISGATIPTGVPVIVDSSGHLGTTTSSARFKEAVKPMDKASEAILALQPVTFRYKHDLDPKGIPQFGLVAEEVEKVNPDLVARDEQGKPYTVRYEAVNAMLLNEFLKEHRKVEQQRKDFEAALTQQQKQIEALAEGLQKVSAQLELSKSPRPTVLNNH